MFVKWIVACAAAVLVLVCGIMATDRVGLKNACACLTPDDYKELDIWDAAQLMRDQYKADAVREASARVDRMLGEGHMASAAQWHRILDAVERLQAQELAEGNYGDSALN